MKGETGVVIAKKHGMGWKAIEAANPGVDARKLKVGQKLIIPAKTVTANPALSGGLGSGTSVADAEGAGAYKVKSGDTLAKIAKSHGTTVKALKAANNLKLDGIKVGQKLRIPGKPVAAPAVAEPAPVAPLTPPPTTLAPPLLTPAPETDATRLGSPGLPRNP